MEIILIFLLLCVLADIVLPIIIKNNVVKSIKIKRAEKKKIR